MQQEAFWQRKSLSDLTEAEWESLCDGCGKCCLHKLEDADTGEVYYTEVACRLLDLESCTCTRYPDRLKHVPACASLSSANVKEFDWLPETCAYRLVAAGKPLPQWHHLISGSHTQVHEQKWSIRGRVLREDTVAEEDLEDHIIHWVS